MSAAYKTAAYKTIYDQRNGKGTSNVSIDEINNYAYYDVSFPAITDEKSNGKVKRKF